jgi:acid phosphatase
MRSPRWPSFVVLLAILAACRTAAPASPAGSAAQPGAAPAVRHTHENLNAIVWMQTSVEYRAATTQAYRAAQAALDRALADTRSTAAVEQTGDPSGLSPAVILDLDETVLDNSAFQARQVADSTPVKGVGYDPAAWSRFVGEEKSGAIAGAVEFLKYARAHGVTPIYVTNRNVKDADGHGEAATRDLLRKLGIPVDETPDTLLLRGENGWDSSDKGPRRAFVAQHYRILLLVGDNFEDFVSVPPEGRSIAARDTLAAKYADRWGTQWIMLPNPTYGSWEQAVTLGAPQGDDAAALARKYAALKLER